MRLPASFVGTDCPQGRTSVAQVPLALGISQRGTADDRPPPALDSGPQLTRSPRPVPSLCRGVTSEGLSPWSPLPSQRAASLRGGTPRGPCRVTWPTCSCQSWPRPLPVPRLVLPAAGVGQTTRSDRVAAVAQRSVGPLLRPLQPTRPGADRAARVGPGWLTGWEVGCTPANTPWSQSC